MLAGTSYTKVDFLLVCGVSEGLADGEHLDGGRLLHISKPSSHDGKSGEVLLVETSISMTCALNSHSPDHLKRISAETEMFTSSTQSFILFEDLFPLPSPSTKFVCRLNILCYHPFTFK